jgi:hypothetical protein
MKNHLKLIKVNDDLDASLAFAKTINPDYIPREFRKEGYASTLEAVEEFRKEGWKIFGVREFAADYGKAGAKRIDAHTVQLIHPDIVTKESNKTDSQLSVIINNSVTGRAMPLTMSLGMYRLVCSNGLISRVNNASTQIHHGSGADLKSYVYALNQQANAIVNDFEQMKQHILTPVEIDSLARQAIAQRYNIPVEDQEQIQTKQFLQVTRPEDSGSDLWLVYNRLQESLSKDLTNPWDYQTFNRSLTELAAQYQLA